MKPKHVVIIGAGLGGLECGYILSKNGMRVTVLEHDRVVGGCLQSFRRGNTLFDTGFHYIGGLEEGQSLHGLFRYFGLLNLPWRKLDEQCFDEVVIGNRSFSFANGHERFRETLTMAFPHEKEGLRRYTEVLKRVGEHLPDTFLPAGTVCKQGDNYFTDSLFARSAYEFLCDTIHDPLLRKVLSGTSLKMELDMDTLPLYVFAQINNSYIQSAWRIDGGGQQLVDRLAEQIRINGGQVLTSATVTSIIEREGKAIGVRVNKDEFIEADYVIAAQHPQAVMQLLTDSPSIRKVYRRRIASLQNSFGMFTANIQLKDGANMYENKNIYVHKRNADMWHVNGQETESVLVNFYHGQDAVDLLTPLRWEAVAQWSMMPQGRRGQDYVEFKEQKTEECLRIVENRLPQLRGMIEKVYTSTPLSYQNYTLTHHGAAFGIKKDYRSPLTTVLSPRTPLENLYLTGQNLNLHGVLGVSMTAVLTCAELLGMETLAEQLDVKHWNK